MEVKKGLPDRNGVKVGYKQTEVGVIPEDWEVKKLNTICDVRDGTHESPKYLDDGVTFITSKNIINGKIDFSDVTLISKNDAININKRSKVNKGDILMSMIGTIGNSVLIDFEPDFCIKNVALFKPQKVLGRFFIQLLYSLFYQTYINGKLDGGIQKFISLGVMREFDVPLPPTKAEQTAIATALSDADVMIQSLEKLIAKKRLLKQGAMQELLKPKEGWVVKKLGEIGIFKKGKGIKKDEVGTEGYPCIRYGELYTHHDEYIKLFNSFINEQTAKESQRINKGDILFAGSGETKEEIGKCAALVDELIAYAGGDVIILTPIDCDSMFLGFLLNHSMVAKQKAQKAQGDAVVHIYPSSLSEISIHLPQKSEQTSIATILSDMDTEISALETKLSKYKLIKQGMMQNLLTGKIRLV